MMLKNMAVIVGMVVAFGACGTDDPEEGAGGSAGTAAGTAGKGMGGGGSGSGGAGGQSDLGEGGEAYGPGSARWDACTEWCGKAAQTDCWDAADTSGAGGEAGATEKPFPDCVKLICDDDIFGDVRLCPELYTAWIECSANEPLESFECNGKDENGHLPCWDEHLAYMDCTNNL